MSDPIIQLSRVAKKFKRYNKVRWKILDTLGVPIPESKYESFSALENIDLEINRGERISLIGPNGAGKTTLIKMLAGQIKPDCGTISVSGSVGVLFALGVGFNKLFTGRENAQIYLTIHAPHLSPTALDDAIEDIIDFADLKEFFDRPIREYSSGMLARLAFAAATVISPEILLVDEILGVGDGYFFGKSRKRMNQMVENGSTVIFVSHDLSACQLISDRGLWLEEGKVLLDAPIKNVTQSYRARIIDKENRDFDLKMESVSERLKIGDTSFFAQEIYGDKSIQITDFGFLDPAGNKTFTLVSGQSASVFMEILAPEEPVSVVAVVTVYLSSGECALQLISNRYQPKFDGVRGRTKISATMESLFLGPGNYMVSIGLYKNVDNSISYESEAYMVLDRGFELKVNSSEIIATDIGIVNQTASWFINKQ